ncbi:MAG: DNA-directed RNA polymerase subunit L [Candidatus Korarchaeota archaeon NZ13-K]|nr:MAG: DNA-directed RNA polymerase subunit L [Candidatus Korarchaeota archaeon NZ13-K]
MITLEVEVVKVSGNEIRLIVRGETYTLLDPLVDELNSLEEVEFAGYDVPHPLKEESVLFLRVREGMDPREVLRDSVRRLIWKYEEVERSFLEQMSNLKG